MYILGRHIALGKHIDLLTGLVAGHVYHEHRVTGGSAMYQDIANLHVVLAGKRIELLFERQCTAVSENSLEIFTKNLAETIRGCRESGSRGGKGDQSSARYTVSSSL